MPKYLTKIVLTNTKNGEDQAFEPIDAKETLAQKNTQYVLNVQAMAALGFDAKYLGAHGFKTALPAPASEPGNVGTVRRTTKDRRRDTLTPVIELAQSQCRNRQDTAEVWGRLQVLAESKSPPLIGATEDGLQYLKNGVAAIFKRDDLGKRLRR